jgi:hypothetical protein
MMIEMEPIHPLAWNDGSVGPFGETVSFFAEVRENLTTPAGIAPPVFRWFEEDLGDELADEILAWASAEKPASSRMVAQPLPMPVIRS